MSALVKAGFPNIILPRRPGIERPRWPYTINRASVQANGLTFLCPMEYFGSSGLSVELVSGQHGTLEGSPARISDVLMRSTTDFDSVDDLITFPSKVYFHVASPFSMSFWINLDDFSDPRPGICQFQSDATVGDADGFKVIAIDRAVDFDNSPILFCNTEGSAAGGNDSYAETEDFGGTLLNAWNHFLITYNGNGLTTIGNFTMYRNGVDEPLKVASAFQPGHGNQTMIGRGGSANDFWDGRMADVRAYDIELGQPVARQMANAHTRWDVYEEYGRVFYSLAAVAITVDLADTLLLTDILARVDIGAFEGGVMQDVVSFTEELITAAPDQAITMPETLTPTEDLTVDVEKVLEDTLAPTEDLGVGVEKVFDETLAPAEDLGVAVEKVLEETLAPTEQLAVTQEILIEEAVSLEDELVGGGNYVLYRRRKH